MSINQCFRSLHVGLPEDILRRKLYGDFDGAVRLIDQRLSQNNLPQPLRDCLTAQREMILRTPADYVYTRQTALERLREHIPDFSEEEFDQRVDAGKLGWLYIDGQPRYFNRFFETMCKAEPAFARRAGVPLPGAGSAGPDTREDLLDRSMRRMKEKGSLSNRITIRASVRMKDELFQPGQFVRVHLPLPAACPQQSGITIDEISPSQAYIDLEDTPQRTVCWEERMTENHEFSVQYTYIYTAQYHNLDYGESAERQPDFFLQEEPPHILFTPYLKQLAGNLTQDLIDPLEKARRIYDFITLNMKYTFMPAYFILENIAENCARNFTGDCGVFALLFLTLCRIAGIPACWQSGLTAEPNFCGGHDWVRFYVEPFGWLFADPSYGVAAVRAGSEERRKFYFGNLDPYRMVANNAFQAPFTVEKAHWRADPYDNQVGEMETEERGLGYGEFLREKAVIKCEEFP